MWKIESDNEELKKLAKNLLIKEPAKYSLLYGFIANLNYTPFKMIRYKDLAIGLQTDAKKPLVISDIEDKNMILEFVDFIKRDQDIKNLVGSKYIIDEVLSHVGNLAQGLPEVIMEQGIYQATKVKVRKILKEQSFRIANENDIDFVSKCFHDFLIDAWIDESPSKDKMKTIAENRIKRKEVYLLESKNKPVSMACWGRASDQGVSINTVFTPTQYRGLGHGTKVTGHLCQILLERFPKCFLYVDKAQPHTAKIYEKLGFKYVIDSLDVKIKD